VNFGAVVVTTALGATGVSTGAARLSVPPPGTDTVNSAGALPETDHS
jgi:hypothetical protein